MKNLIHKLINRETVIYLVFGILTTAVNYLIFYLCRRMSVHVLVANIIAWTGAVMFAFITNKLFVFDSRSFRLKLLIPEIAGFVSARLLSLLFEEGFLSITCYAGINEYAAKLAAAVIVIILNYFASKFIIFKKKENQHQEVSDNEKQNQKEG